MKKHELCPVKGCGKITNGKPYCPKHVTLGQRRKLSSDLALLIRSHCCNARCVSGEEHDIGEQYCTKCKQPCVWKTGVAAA